MYLLLAYAGKGILNPFLLRSKGPGIKALDIAAEKAGTKIYVYDITKFSLVNNKPFRSILPCQRQGVRQKFYLFQLTHYLKNWTASYGSKSKPFKGYFYYSKPQNKVPK